MTRTRLLATALAAAIPLAAAAQASAAPAPPAKPIRAIVKKLSARTGVPVFAPSYLKIEHVKGHPLVVTGSADADSWDIELAYVRHCGGATACFAGSLTGERVDYKLGRSDGKAVALRNGITGRFRPLSCGVSCSPPSISWQVRDVVYRYQLNTGLRQASERKAFVRMANSAITAGAR